MKYLLKATMLLTLLVSLTGCITYEQIKQPAEGSDQEKIARFDYMEGNWSYLHSRWIRGQAIMPEDLVHIYGIPVDQAKSDINEFVYSQYNYNWFHCFLLSIYMDETRFYID